MKILITGGSGFIGTNYIELLLKNGQAEFLNLDNSPPRNGAHKSFWRECDLLDASRLKSIIADFSPTHVVHLAAKTELDEKNLSDFAANMEGVENLLNALKEVTSVERVIFTSSLLVCRMGYVPEHDTDYQPTTLYGESKVEGEKIVRAAKNLPYAWIIIRPISIWGPWGEEPYKNFFKAIAQGWYFHIGSGHYKRSLGYVENTAHQIHQILLSPIEKVDRKTMYVADDQPADLYDMANMIRQAVGARKIHHVPLWMAKLAAKIGDGCKAAGWHSVPLSSFRLNNIRTEYVFDMQPIMEVSGPLPYNFKIGIEQTVEWLREMGEI
ncbi:MAG: 3 beta-hydroxysteroid dehydrogenase/Delta 5--_4-isomerase [Syntrophomonadaceae bacterium]|nr:3 beta-hydroxysteroid dehydrogenase/Delta 5-->4-isomerase [Bacillota bacterium]